jgi:MarR family transcriptional regulator, organic hydroperoxide resistance regulator
MAKSKAAVEQATDAEWHETFRNSLFYWTGLLEDRYNQLFVKAMRPARVTVSRYRTLAILAELDELTVNELARHSSIERSALSRLLDQLEREALIVRRPHRADRRALQIRITATGRAAFAAMRPVRRAVLKRATEGITPGEIERMRTVIQLMLHNLDAAAGAPKLRRAMAKR